MVSMPTLYSVFFLFLLREEVPDLLLLPQQAQLLETLLLLDLLEHRHRVVIGLNATLLAIDTSASPLLASISVATGADATLTQGDIGALNRYFLVVVLRGNSRAVVWHFGDSRRPQGMVSLLDIELLRKLLLILTLFLVVFDLPVEQLLFLSYLFHFKIYK